LWSIKCDRNTADEVAVFREGNLNKFQIKEFKADFLLIFSTRWTFDLLPARPVTAEVMLPVAVPWTDKYRFFSIHVTADGQELLEKQVVTAPETWPFTRLDVIVAGQIDWD
jgi:hypothetical protein